MHEKGHEAKNITNRKEIELTASTSAQSTDDAPQFAPLDPSERYLGSVKWFEPEKGYGFITPINEKGEQIGEDILVHFTSIRGEGYKSLDQDEIVEFGIDDAPTGRMTKDVKTGMKLPYLIPEPEPKPQFAPLDTDKRYQGDVNWFNPERGFGFITPVNDNGEQIGNDIYVHYSAIQEEGYKNLDDGERVQFGVQKDEKYGYSAKEVTPSREKAQTADFRTRALNKTSSYEQGR